VVRALEIVVDIKLVVPELVLY